MIVKDSYDCKVYMSDNTYLTITVKIPSKSDDCQYMTDEEFTKLYLEEYIMDWMSTNLNIHNIMRVETELFVYGTKVIIGELMYCIYSRNDKSIGEHV